MVQGVSCSCHTDRDSCSFIGVSNRQTELRDTCSYVVDMNGFVASNNAQWLADLHDSSIVADIICKNRWKTRYRPANLSPRIW